MEILFVKSVIKNLNLLTVFLDILILIGVKNSYLLKKDISKIKEKERAVIKKGYRYFLIVDKNYKKFEDVVVQHL